MILENFRCGLNIGGWLAQYDIVLNHELSEQEITKHLDKFITENDIVKIKGFGADHIRIPIDARLFVSEYKPYKRIEKGFKYLKQCVEWCIRHNLNVIIDLHDIKGNAYNQMEAPIDLLVSESIIERFIYIWCELAREFKDVKKIMVMFELFNEITDASGGYLWNRLCKRTVGEIRTIDLNRPILIGANRKNSVSELDKIDLLDYNDIYYNFHFYDPEVFTHQRAHFSEEHREFNREITYPGDISEFNDYLKDKPYYLAKHYLTVGENKNDFNLMKKLLADANRFKKYSGKELYCGEVGVINSAPKSEAIKWFKDFIRLANEYGFGFAVWNYKDMDFGIVDKENNIISKEFIKAVFGK